MQGHTGFLVTARKLAPGVILPARRIRPTKGGLDTVAEVEASVDLGKEATDD
jgi:tRNA (adenine57-N1/adenine58-N1)-methyltransferase